MRRRHRPCRAALLALALVPALLPPVPAGAGPLEIRTAPVSRFCGADGEDLRGGMRFVGGFAYVGGRGGSIDGVSAFRFLDAGARFLAVTDEGFWFSGAILRDAEGRPVGIAGAEKRAMLNVNGRPVTGKIVTDAESLTLSGTRAVVGFERTPRLLAYERADLFAARPAELPLPIPRRELRANGGMETLATAPEASPLRGASVAIAEKSIDRNGNLLAAVFGARDPATNGAFALRRDPSWDATDGVFLPGGDLLLLEREFTGLFGRIGMRIRRIAGDEIRPGALVDGPVIAEADLSCEIDNMEGIDVFETASGETRLALVSDNNSSFLQRNLYLEFSLAVPETAAALTPPR